MQAKQPTYSFKRIKANDPLCQELQNGHDSYRLGLIFTDAPVIKDSTGEWLIGPLDPGMNEGWDVQTKRSYANVHPFSRRHDVNLRVYGIRFFIPACDSCGKNEDYGNRWLWSDTECPSCCKGGE